MTAVALVDVNPLDGDPGPGLGTFDGGFQGVAVIGIAVQGVDMDDELATGRASVGGGDRDLAAKFLGLGCLALADTFDLGGV